MSEHVLELLLRELDVDPDDVVTVPGLLDLTALWQLARASTGPTSRTSRSCPPPHPAFAERRDRQERLRHAARGRRARPPPVRLVLHERAALHRAGRRRPERARDQADALPHLGRLPDRRRAHRRGRGGQAGRGAGGDQGAVRRAGQHPVGARAGAGGRARRLRARRAQDALQDVRSWCARRAATIRRYCHIGTGNYNPKTARLYEDLGVLTADPAIGADLTDLFNALTGYSRQTSYQSLLVAPYGVRRGIVRRIEDEIEAHREGKDDARDPDQGQLARRRAGDRRAVPGVAGRGAGRHRRARDLRDPAGPRGAQSENIHVRSILGRFLEHSRVFHFGAADEYWIGSADMMHRNLDRRVEVLLRVADRAARRASWARCSTRASTRPPAAGRSRPDGSWWPSPSPDSGVSPVRDHQAEMMHAATHAARPARRGGMTPRRAARRASEPVDVRAAGAVVSARATATIARRCTAPATTTGRCPRASSSPASRCRRGRARGRRGDRGRRAARPVAAATCRYAVPEGRKVVRYWSARRRARQPTSRRTRRWTSCAGSPPDRPRRAADLRPRPGRAAAVRRARAARRRRSCSVRHAKAGSRRRVGRRRRPAPAVVGGPGAGRATSPRCCRCSGPDRHRAARRRCAAATRSRRWPTQLGLPVDDEPLLGEDGYWDEPRAGCARLRELAARPGVTAVAARAA